MAGGFGLKSIKELASATGRSRTYIHAAKAAMEAQGLYWPTNQMTVEVFLQWCAANRFRCSGYCRRAEKARTPKSRKRAEGTVNKARKPPAGARGGKVTA
jgi:hypothetical protein